MQLSIPGLGYQKIARRNYSGPFRKRMLPLKENRKVQAWDWPLANSLYRLCQGILVLSSEDGKGSTFWFTASFPIAEKPVKDESQGMSSTISKKEKMLLG